MPLLYMRDYSIWIGGGGGGGGRYLKKNSVFEGKDKKTIC